MKNTRRQNYEIKQDLNNMYGYGINVGHLRRLRDLNPQWAYIDSDKLYDIRIYLRDQAMVTFLKLKYH